jgi:hypothetical protein
MTLAELGSDTPLYILPVPLTTLHPKRPIARLPPDYVFILNPVIAYCVLYLASSHCL